MEAAATTESIWSDLHDKLFWYIRGRVATGPDAEDVLQDVFLRIQSKLSGLDNADSVTAWVFAITRNAITDYYRSLAKTAGTLEALANEPDSADDVAHLDEPDPWGTEARGELSRCIEPLVRRLPAPYGQALTLTELEGITQAGAAQQLGLSVSGMKSRVQRGRGKLKDSLLECCNFELDRRGGVVEYEPRNAGWCDDETCV